MQRHPNHVVQSLRAFLALSQAAFGAEVDLPQSYVSYVERGHRRLTSDAALRIKDRFADEMGRLGLTVEDLLRGYRETPGAGKREAAAAR